MKYIHIIFIITFILTIEIHKVISRPYSSWETSSSWTSHTSSDGTTTYTKNEHSSQQNNGKTVEVNKSDTTVTKPDGTTYKKNNNNNSSSKSNPQLQPQPQPKPQPQPQPKAQPPQPQPKQPATQNKATTTKPKTSKTTNPPTTVAPQTQQAPPPPPTIPIPTTTVQSIAVPDVSSTVSQIPTVEPVIDASINNICAQHCSTIFSKCQYFSTLTSLNDYTLSNIYPPPQNMFGECLCKSDQNHIGFYSECAKCLFWESQDPDLNVTDQLVQSNCKAIISGDKSQQNLLNSNINNNNSTITKGDGSYKKVELPEVKSFNPRNLIIICSIVGGVLTLYGGYKFRNYVKDKRRESLPMY